MSQETAVMKRFKGSMVHYEERKRPDRLQMISVKDGAVGRCILQVGLRTNTEAGLVDTTKDNYVMLGLNLLVRRTYKASKGTSGHFKAEAKKRDFNLLGPADFFT